MNDVYAFLRISWNQVQYPYRGSHAEVEEMDDVSSFSYFMG